MKKLLLVAVAALALAAPAAAAPAAAPSCFPKQMSGTACKPFLNPARTVRAVRANLIANGFHTAGLRVSVASPQAITYSGVQDGDRVWGDVFKIGDRKLWRTASWIDPDLGRSVGVSHTFTLSFVA